MKKLTLLFGIIVSVLLWSCGGGSGKQGETTATSQVNEEETLYTREGMTKALTELDISIPEILKYDTILGNTIYFKTKGIDATTREQLDGQYNKIREGLVADGWEESADMGNGQNFGGIHKMAYRYEKLLLDGKSKKIVLIATDYLEDSGDFSLNIGYWPKY